MPKGYFLTIENEGKIGRFTFSSNFAKRVIAALNTKKVYADYKIMLLDVAGGSPLTMLHFTFLREGKSKLTIGSTYSRISDHQFMVANKELLPNKLKIDITEAVKCMKKEDTNSAALLLTINYYLGFDK